MTMAELLIALAMFICIMLAVSAFEVNVFSYKNSISGAYQTAQSAQIILKTMLTELREAEPGANGAYALISAGSTTISFFSDVDNNGTPEQVGYNLIGSTLYRTVIQPTGTTYNVANTSTSTIMTSIQNGSGVTLFQYFDTNYSGTSSPLTQPVTTTSVRLVKINMKLDIDPNRSPLPVTYTVQASFRNLKTNL